MSSVRLQILYHKICLLNRLVLRDSLRVKVDSHIELCLNRPLNVLFKILIQRDLPGSIATAAKTDHHIIHSGRFQTRKVNLPRMLGNIYPNIGDFSAVLHILLQASLVFHLRKIKSILRQIRTD